MFHDSRLSLWKWFFAVALMCQTKQGISACQIQRTLGITYKTAWYLCHRIRAAMQEVAAEPVGGIGEIDETYARAKKRRWRMKSGKQAVIGLRQHNGDLCLVRAADGTSATMRGIVKKNFGSHVEVIMTDESSIYPLAVDKMRKDEHRTINYIRQYAHGDVHPNTVESVSSLLKRGVAGKWRKVTAKHLPAYLDEMCFRFNNRKNPYLFRDMIMRLISSTNLVYKELTAKSDDVA